MNVLIIAQAIYPKLSPRAHRATELAKELVSQGHNVTLCAVLGKYDYTNFQKENKIKIENLGVSEFEWVTSDLDNRNISLWRKGIIFFLQRILAFPDILIGIRVAKYLRNIKGYDKIITLAVPHSIHWGAAYAKRKYENLATVTWIADCGDPFMGNPFDSPPFYFEWVERFWCRMVDYITVPTSTAIDAYYSDFRNKIKVIPQGFSFVNELSLYRVNRIPTFAYSGMVYPHKRDPRGFLKYLIHSVSFDFKFIVYTNKPKLFEEYRGKLDNKLEIRTYIPRKELLYELSKMDFLINIENESSVQQPSKLIDYYLSGRPILSITSQFRQGESFLNFCKGNYEEQLLIADVHQYDIVNVCKEFMRL